MTRGHVALAIGLAGLLLQGCATKPVVYGPIGPDAPHGYKDRQNADGGFTVMVAMPGGSPPAALRDFFDRRAHELCPAGVDRTNIFRMQRNDVTSMSYGSKYGSVGSRLLTGDELEGYVYCKPGSDTAKTEVSPASVTKPAA